MVCDDEKLKDSLKDFERTVVKVARSNLLLMNNQVDLLKHRKATPALLKFRSRPLVDP